MDAVIKRQEILERANFVAREHWTHLVHHRLGVIGAGAFDEENGGFVARSGQILQRGQRHEDARALAMLDDSSNVKVMIEQAEGAVYGDLLGLRCPIVDQNIVRALHVMAFKKNKPSGNVAERFRVDSVNDVDAA